MQWEYTLISGRIMAPEDSDDFRGQGLDLLWKTETEAPTTWQHIQQAGRDGWELVSAFPIAEYTEEENAGYTSIVAFVFKRPRQANLPGRSRTTNGAQKQNTTNDKSA